MSEDHEDDVALARWLETLRKQSDRKIFWGGFGYGVGAMGIFVAVLRLIVEAGQ